MANVPRCEVMSTEESTAALLIEAAAIALVRARHGHAYEDRVDEMIEQLIAAAGFFIADRPGGGHSVRRLRR
jgi:hypothetical protein